LNAENAFAVGDYVKARDLFQQAIQKDQASLLSKIRLADILTRVKKYDESIEYINSIKDTQGDYDTVMNQKLAENYFFKKDYTKSDDLIKTSLSTNGKNIFLIKLMLKTHLIQGRYQDALTFISTYDEAIFDDELLFYKRVIQINNSALHNSSTTYFDDKSIQNLFVKIENNIADYKSTDKKLFGAINICFELLQYNYFDLAKPFSEDIINLNRYMDTGYYYKGISLLALDYPEQAQELFKQAYTINASNVDFPLMIVLTNIILDQVDQIDNSLDILSKVIDESDKYKLIELLKYANENKKTHLVNKLFQKFPKYFEGDMTATYLKVKSNAITDNYEGLLGDINKLFADSHYLNYKQKVLLLSIKGYIIAKDTNQIAGKNLILKGLEIDKYCHFCYYYLAKINLLQNDKLSYDINYNKSKDFDIFQELKYE
jgi:hypothetical protein